MLAERIDNQAASMLGNRIDDRGQLLRSIARLNVQ